MWLRIFILLNRPLQVCLCGLFFLAHAYPHAILMIVLIILTMGFHMIINHSYGPLLYALPLSLKDKILRLKVSRTMLNPRQARLEEVMKN